MTSRAPGQGQLTQSLLTPSALAAASLDELAQTAAAIQAEHHRRALESDDLDALIEQAYLDGFTSRGEPATPWIHNGLLVCPGFIRHKSATSHDCQFVSIDGEWVWTTPGQLYDGMREVPGPKTLRNAITIVHADEGLTFDVVESQARSGGGCQMKKVTSYQIRSGELTTVATRARAPKAHAFG